MATLPEALASLSRQTGVGDEFEVLVVDNGSTDDTKKFVLEMCRQHRWLRFEDMGEDATDYPASSRNRGLERARGDVVIFMDGDILVGPDFVQQHRAAHEAASPCEVAVIGHLYGYPLDIMERTPEAMNPPRVQDVLDRLPQLLLQDPRHWRDGRESYYRFWPDMTKCPMPWFFFWAGNVFVRRKMALGMRGFDEKFRTWGFEDIELGYRLWKRGVPFTFGRHAWGIHYPHATRYDGGAVADRTRRLFVETHPEPYAELMAFAGICFNQPGASRVRWETLDLLSAPPLPRRPVLEVFRSLMAEVRRRWTGQIACFCDLPDGVLPTETPHFLSRPFRGPARQGEAALIGLCLPQEDATFACAVLIDYWRHFSASALLFICAEATRVAPVCILSLLGNPTAKDRELIGALADRSDYRVEVCALGDVHSWTVRRQSV